MKQIHFASIDSTNTYAKNCRNELPQDEITCIGADEQTAGHGKFNRPWLSPKGVNIYATFFFTLPKDTKQVTCLAQVMAASVTKVLIQENIEPKIKWPNDLQLNGKKLCGVLCELVFQSETIAVILGFGVNVNMEATELQTIGQPATSLKIETGKTWDKEELLKKIQMQFEQDLLVFKENGFAPFHYFVEQRLSNQTVKFFDGKQEWIGTYQSLNADGGLNINLSDQTIRTIYSLS